jgi:hypothetical protein
VIEFLLTKSHELEQCVYCYLYYEGLDSTLGMLQSLYALQVSSKSIVYGWFSSIKQGCVGLLNW